MRNPRLSKQSLCIVQPGANIRYLDENTHVVQGINRIVNGDFFLSTSALSRYHTVNCVTCAHSHTPSNGDDDDSSIAHNVHQCCTFWMWLCARMNGCDFLFTWKMLGKAIYRSINKIMPEYPESVGVHQDAHCNASECYFNVNTELVRIFFFIFFIQVLAKCLDIKSGFYFIFSLAL